jgi:hypothetical protein
MTGATACAMIIGVAIVGFVFLSPFLRGSATTPFGFDTPHYIWRANLVIVHGLDGLDQLDPSLQANPNPDRPANPVFAAVTDRTLGIDPGWLAYINPAVFAICVGLAGAAFAREVLEEPLWGMPLYLVLLGGSLFVVRTAVGSMDNLQVDGVLIAGATAALLFGTLRRGGAGAVLVFIGAFLIHWIFAGLFMLLLLGLAVVLVPYSYTRLRSGDRLFSTPSLRIGGVAIGSTAAAAIAIKLSTGSPLTRPHVPRRAIESKVAARIPMLRLPLSFAIAALGAVALWWPRSPRRRIGLTMLAMWALTVPVGYLVYDLRNHHLPLYRIAEFALALPILAAALGIGLVRLGWRYLRVAGAVLGALIVVGAIVIQLSVSRDAWEASPALLQPARVQQVATAAAYLEAVHAEGPVIFLTELPAYAPTSLLVRAGVPGDLVPYVRTFVGRPDDLLAGRQTVFPSEKLRTAADLSWQAVEPVLDQDYIALYLSALNPVSDPPPDAMPVAPGVFVIRGPSPPYSIPLAPVARPDTGRLIRTTIEMLVFLSVAGLGWAAGSTDSGWLSRVALSPAFGLALLVLVAMPVARLGEPLSRTAAWAIVVGTALSGWVVFALVRTVGPRLAAPAARSGEAGSEAPSSDEPDDGERPAVPG